MNLLLTNTISATLTPHPTGEWEFGDNNLIGLWEGSPRIFEIVESSGILTRQYHPNYMEVQLRELSSAEKEELEYYNSQEDIVEYPDVCFEIDIDLHEEDDEFEEDYEYDYDD